MRLAPHCLHFSTARNILNPNAVFVFFSIDQEYRERVVSALAKYHGREPGVERKPRRRPHGSSESPRRTPVKKAVSSETGSSKSELKFPALKLKSRRRNAPSYKDPLASSKLEMLKNIRAQRAATEIKKIEAIERAR